MKSQLQPWHSLLLILAGWINRRQQDAVQYLLAENQRLREKLGKIRILLDDYQRRRLAIKGKILGRKVLDELATIVTPETILRRHRKLVAAHGHYSKSRKSCGRPPVGQEMVGMVLRMVSENPACGYDRIQGALAHHRKMCQQAIIQFPVTNRIAAHRTQLKHGQGIALSRRRSKLLPIHVSSPSRHPQLQEVRVFSPHAVISLK